MAAAHANYRESLRAMARMSPAGAIHERGGATFIATGIPVGFLNPVMMSDGPRSTEVIIEEAFAFFGPREVPWQVTAWDAAGEAFAANHPGLRYTGSSPGMLLQSFDHAPRSVPGFEVREVRDLAALDVYAQTLCTGFGMPAEWGSYIAQPAFLGVIDQTAFLGFADGRPVATGLRLTTHRIAGVFNISTVPEARGRGYGEAITWAATLGGREEGAIAAYLQASTMGRPIYERMGYVHVADYHQFAPAGQPH